MGRHRTSDQKPYYLTNLVAQHDYVKGNMIPQEMLVANGGAIMCAVLRGLP